MVPAVDIVSVIRNVVRVRLHDAADASRTKPAGVKGAAIMTAITPVAPTNPSDYAWQGNTNRSEIDVIFPEETAPGTMVWITAMWLNEKQECGPACTPISATIQYGILVGGVTVRKSCQLFVASCR